MKTLKIEFDDNGFYPKEFTDENGDTYVLGGYCSNCGKCCKINQDETGFCKNRVYETVDGVVNYRCAIYETRPAVCMLWPSSLSDIQMFEGCTYTYTKKEI